ncbi:MAG: CDP-glycerol glycerophosphotransferase family protein [Bacteroidaceae bacterium]|nr:CDP-glycerol glycerophosphotransferase family protein [Bacteroidaceae bacterium]
MKFIAYIICYLIYPFSFLFPRNRRKYVFGSYRGSFADNAKYLFLYSTEHGDRDIDYIWLSTRRATVKKVRSLGLRAFWVLEPRGVWHALTSRYWFVNSYTSDIMFCLSGRAVCINLWHGVGIKRIEYNATSGPLADRYMKKDKYDVFCHPESFRKPDWVLSSTPYQNHFFSTSFRIPVSRCLEMGYPRNRILTTSEEERSRFVGRFEPQQTSELISRLKGYNKVYIYMPTFRDSQLTVFTQSMDLERLNRIMADTNSMLILKPHANVRLTENFSSLTNIMLASPIMDIYPILPYVHVLITDYSSIIYDWLLMEGKDVILYLYDYDAYVRERDFFYPFDENVTGCRVDSFDSLCSVIESGDYTIDKEERKRILERFWGETAQYDSSGMILDFVKTLKRKK